MRIFIIGFMGSGKTKRGKKIAGGLGYSFYDLDELIEKKYNRSVFEIFQNSGEETFRNFEHAALTEIIGSDNFVLSAGGGTPCFCNNMEIMNSHGITLYLKADKQFLKSRLICKTDERPLLKGKSEAELEEFIKVSLAFREKFYNKARLVYDAVKVKNKEIINQLKEMNINNPV
jgi:shikimate kinase